MFDDSTVATATSAAARDEADTLLYQMERKYFCAEEEACREKSAIDDETFIIDIFGSSPFPFGNSPLVAAHGRVLELLVLDNLGICRVGATQRLATMARNVTELVLNGNRLGWTEVGELYRTFPQLRTLNLSHNAELNSLPPTAQRHGEDGDTGALLPEARKLDTLILNGLSLSFPILRSVLRCSPALRELHLSRNNFVDFAPISSQFCPPILCFLRELHLNECALSEWCEVLTILSHFPMLNSLFLAGNPISMVERVCSCGNETEKLCCEMTSLSLSNTMLSNWEAVENLRVMHRLEELRVAHIPLLDAFSEEERRYLVIGRLRSLKMLNGSKIDPHQREESERFFIRHYAEAEKPPLIYDRLVAEHGILEQLVKVDLTPKRHAKVIIHCEEADWVRIWVRLRLSGTVHGLMKLAERLTSIPIKMMRIFYVDKACGPIELRTPAKQLRLLHIEDGDEFVVQSKLILLNSSNSN